MKDFDSDSSPESDWDERGELAWNEFDWENYLREQDDVVRRYLAHYEGLKHNPERIDEIAHRMGWDQETWNTEDTGETPDVTAAPADLGEYDLEPTRRARIPFSSRPKPSSRAATARGRSARKRGALQQAA